MRLWKAQPDVIAILGILLCLVVAVVNLWQKNYLRAATFVLFGVAFYFPCFGFWAVALASLVWGVISLISGDVVKGVVALILVVLLAIFIRCLTRPST